MGLGAEQEDAPCDSSLHTCSFGKRGSVKRGRGEVRDKVSWREKERETVLGKVMGWVRQERRK